jgi:hypothetical protein
MRTGLAKTSAPKANLEDEDDDEYEDEKRPCRPTLGLLGSGGEE